MTVPLRLLSRGQMKALEESQLHKVLCQKHQERVVEVLTPFSALYADDPKVSLDVVQRWVAERLQSIDGLDSEVIDAVAAGGLSLGAPELWLALGCWVVENQLIEQPSWDPSRRPKV
jgi:hypothetical protein